MDTATLQLILNALMDVVTNAPKFVQLSEEAITYINTAIQDFENLIAEIGAGSVSQSDIDATITKIQSQSAAIQAQS